MASSVQRTVDVEVGWWRNAVDIGVGVGVGAVGVGDRLFL
jgi:hypothetical protein